MSGIMNGGGSVIAPMNKGYLAALCGHPRKDFADLDSRDVGLDWFVWAANLRRCSGLHVPCVEVAGAAEQEDHDAIHVFRLIDCTLSLETEKLRKRQAEHGE